MDALGRLWTWTGTTFVPLAVGWMLFVRGGMDGPAPAPGVLITRAYWGLLLALAVAGLLSWTSVLYARAARRAKARLLVPPNTTFETGRQRNRLISWGTALIFVATVLSSLVVFSVRYGDSRIHGWEEPMPLADGFWSSRQVAGAKSCPDQPCFAVSSRWEGANKPLTGVNEYIPIVTDGAVLAAALPLVSCLLFVVYQAVRRLLRLPRLSKP